RVERGQAKGVKTCGPGAKGTDGAKADREPDECETEGGGSDPRQSVRDALAASGLGQAFGARGVKRDVEVVGGQIDSAELLRGGVPPREPHGGDGDAPGFLADVGNGFDTHASEVAAVALVADLGRLRVD